MAHAPDPKCRTCKGTGVKPSFIGSITGTHIPASDCICTFIDHDMIERVRPIFREVVRRLEQKEKSPRVQPSIPRT